MTKQKIEYVRPSSLDEVLRLRAEHANEVKFLAGGIFKPMIEDGKFLIVDLQEAGLDEVEANEDGLRIGGLASLQELENALGSSGFYQALSTEYGINVRNTLSLSNFLAQANGRSPVLICLVALEPIVYSFDHPDGVELLTFLRASRPGNVVTGLQFPNFQKLTYEGVGRSPKDLPVVSVAAVKRADQSIRVACGGTIEIWDGFTLSDLDDDGQDAVVALYQTAEDGWASAEYRQSVAQVLLARALQNLERIA